MSQEGKLELTDASRSAKTVAEGIPEGFHLANSERVTAKAQERLAMSSPTPHHLQLLLVPLQRLQHRQENQPPVVIAQHIFRAALRMRHHAEHIALCVDDSRNVIQRAVRIRFRRYLAIRPAIAEHDLRVRLHRRERDRIGIVIAVCMGNRNLQHLPGLTASREYCRSILSVRMCL